eukprot:gnl/TRDRNA2_/TRDRNA2_63231_c0_seq1.p1 gnl/TRDRNA2_/TRDRNA2_63231_c0~~gnl/TRDRNA2_/TRDRNA2_63231_c0_seq1.p1  ORF type:complete len:438 (+),score=65.53 gnl/TRDRNA2_/TRDRNA2_63231_c0_seq1:1-1314(+)
MLASTLARGQFGLDSMDLRRSTLSLDALVQLCQALEDSVTTAAKHAGTAAKLLPRRVGLGETAPCWLELGDNPGFEAEEAVSRLRGHGLHTCVPVRCSKRRCLYGATVHLNCRVFGRGTAAGICPQIIPPKSAASAAPVPPGALSHASSGGPAGHMEPRTHNVQTTSSAAATRSTRVMAAASDNMPQSASGAPPPPAAKPIGRATPSAPPPLRPDGGMQQQHPSMQMPVSQPVPMSQQPMPVSGHEASAVLAASLSPFVLPTTGPSDLRSNQRAFAVFSRSRSDASRECELAVQEFEELEVLTAAPLSIFGCDAVQVRRIGTSGELGWTQATNLVGDPCSDRCFQLLKAARDAGGMTRLIEHAVERLGGSVVDAELCLALARSFCGDDTAGLQPALSFQALVVALHDRARRNAAGIRMPGDYYGIRNYYSESFDRTQ